MLTISRAQRVTLSPTPSKGGAPFTGEPSQEPTVVRTRGPTSVAPTLPIPTQVPTFAPTDPTFSPTPEPTPQPTPTDLTESPTPFPSISFSPTTCYPSSLPSISFSPTEFAEESVWTGADQAVFSFLSLLLVILLFAFVYYGRESVTRSPVDAFRKKGIVNDQLSDTASETTPLTSQL